MTKTFKIRGIEITIYCDDLSEPGTVSKLECDDLVGLLDILDHKAEIWPWLRGESNLGAICQLALSDNRANGVDTTASTRPRTRPVKRRCPNCHHDEFDINGFCNCCGAKN